MTGDGQKRRDSGKGSWKPSEETQDDMPIQPNAPAGWRVTLADTLAWLYTTGVMLRDKLVRPLARLGAEHYKKLRQSMRQRFMDRLVEHETYDGGRAKEWQRFHAGKKSSSYLTDVKDPNQRK